jgi:hypothetical protein
MLNGFYAGNAHGKVLIATFLVFSPPLKLVTPHSTFLENLLADSGRLSISPMRSTNTRSVRTVLATNMVKVCTGKDECLPSDQESINQLWEIAPHASSAKFSFSQNSGLQTEESKLSA